MIFNLLDGELDEAEDRLGYRHRAARVGRPLGAELLGASVLLGDVGYEVQSGFLADAKAVVAGTPGGAGASGGGPGEADVEKKRADAEALARFLLENLP